MNKNRNKDSDYLVDLDWSAVRAIYRKLSDEFHVLTDSYKVSLSARRKIMLDHLIIAIDKVDQSIDEIPDKLDRDELTECMLSFLENDQKEFGNRLATDSLSQNMNVLKLIVHELGVQGRFILAVAKIFKYTEEKRHTNNAEQLIALVQKEGAATAELPLSIMQVPADHPFAYFFNNLCKMMGIADLIVDARSDYRDNYIALKPSLLLYFNLSWILVKEGVRLIWNFPRKLRFIIYCVKFSFLLLVSKD